MLCFVLTVAQVSWAGDQQGNIMTYTVTGHGTNNPYLSDYVVNSSGDELRLIGDGYYERQIAISGSFYGGDWEYRPERADFHPKTRTQTLSIMNLFQGDKVILHYWGNGASATMKSNNTNFSVGSNVSGDGSTQVTMNSNGSMDFSINTKTFITKIQVIYSSTSPRIAFSTAGQESGGYYRCRLSSRSFNEPTLSVYPSNANVTYTVETYDDMYGTKLNDTYHEVAIMNTTDNMKGDVLFKNLGWCKVTATANGQSASYWVNCWDNEAIGELQDDGITYKLVKVKDENGDLLPDNQQGGVLKERTVTAVPGITMMFGIPNDGSEPNTTVAYLRDGHMVSYTCANDGWWDRYEHNNYSWPTQGTFYRFEASAKGKLYFGGFKDETNGKSGKVYLVRISDGFPQTEVFTAGQNGYLTSMDNGADAVKNGISMEPGYIYYLQGEANRGEDKWSPFLLEWFKYETELKLSAEWGVSAKTGYEIGQNGSVTTNETITGASNANCTVTCKGNIQSASAIISGGHIVFSNIQFESSEKDKMGGAMKVDITVGSSTLTYYYTIPYGQHVWDFRKTADQSTECGDFSYTEEELIQMMNDNTNDWTRVYKVHRRVNGEWTELKDPIMAARGIVSGNNAFYMENTNGLAFVTSQPESFGAGETMNSTQGYSSLSQDEQYYLNYTTTLGGNLVWMKGTSTIYFPGVKAGQYIKVYHYRHADNKGETFSAKNLVDLDGVDYDPAENFVLHGMWESRVAGPLAEGRVSGHTGDYMLGAAIFKVPNDATSNIDEIPSLTLTDSGWAQIYKIEISDAYKPDLIMTTEVNGSEAPIVSDGLNNSVVVRVKNDGTKQPVTVVHNAYVSNTGCQNANTCDYEVEADPGVDITVSKGKLSGDWYNKLTIEYNGGYGLVKIIQRERDITQKYVIDKKEYYISVGQLTEQSYPYTWDFTDYNMYKGSSATKGNLSNSLTGNVGSWEKVNEEDGNYRQIVVGNIQMGKNEETPDPYQELTIKKPMFAQGGELVVGNQVMAETEGLGIRLPYASTDVLFPRISSEKYSGTDKQLYAEVFTDRYYKVYDITKSVQVDGNNLTGAAEITIPSVGNGMYIFVDADDAPAVKVGEETKDVVEKYNVADDVYLYQNNSGSKKDVVLSFAPSTKIKRIGVTNIEKSVNKLGFATESRDHAIDHTYTGKFTKNDVNAYIITEENYDYENYKGAKISLGEPVDVIPENTGVVLYKAGTTEQTTAPLFYPAVNAVNSSVEGNMMVANVESQTVNPKNGDYTTFIMSMFKGTYNSTTGESTTPTEQDYEGFYPIQKAGTLGANKAYLQILTSSIPKALWDGGNGQGNANQAKGYILIDVDYEGAGEATAIDHLGMDKENTIGANGGVYYNLSGQKLIGTPTAKGIYVKNGKKVYVK